MRSPLFVTWNKDTRQGDLRLRGCIGTLEPRHLHTALKDYALTRWGGRGLGTVQYETLGCGLHGGCFAAMLSHDMSFEHSLLNTARARAVWLVTIGYAVT